MTRRYLIGSLIEFKPSEQLVFLSEQPSMKVSLNVPASRCLELLIERHPETVPQKEFYPYVWKEMGSTVPVNTLYQNIALLRKAFRTLDGSGKEYITTVSKQGFSLSAFISVTELSDETTLPQQINIPESDTLQNPDVEHTEHHDHTDYQQQRIDKDFIKISKKRYILMFKLFPLCILLVFIIFHIKEKILSSGFDQNYYFPYESSYEKCHIFSNTNETDANIYKNLLSDGLINCSENPFLYVTRFIVGKHITIISCKNPLNSNKAASCQTLSVFGDRE